jgi:hypothetical protein
MVWACPRQRHKFVLQNNPEGAFGVGLFAPIGAVGMCKIGRGYASTPAWRLYRVINDTTSQRPNSAAIPHARGIYTQTAEMKSPHRVENHIG